MQQEVIEVGMYSCWFALAFLFRTENCAATEAMNKFTVERVRGARLSDTIANP